MLKFRDLYKQMNNIDVYILWNVSDDTELTRFINHINMLEKARPYFNLFCDNVDISIDVDKNIIATFYLHD